MAVDHQVVRHQGEGRRRRPFVGQRRDRRPDVRVVFTRRVVGQVHRPRVGVAGGHFVRGAGMSVVAVRERADDGQLVDHAGQPRHAIAERDARHAGGQGVELAANFGRRVGLGVEGIEMRWSALEPNQDARAGPAEAGQIAKRLLPGLRLALKKLRQTKADETHRACSQQPAAGQRLIQRSHRSARLSRHGFGSRVPRVIVAGRAVRYSGPRAESHPSVCEISVVALGRKRMLPETATERGQGHPSRTR